jgi:hypothetical protein
VVGMGVLKKRWGDALGVFREGISMKGDSE